MTGLPVTLKGLLVLVSSNLLARIGCGSWLASIVVLGLTVTAVPTDLTSPTLAAAADGCNWVCCCTVAILAAGANFVVDIID